MKILFINPPWYRLQNLVSTYPPMGSLYIASLLEKNGYDCVIWNADYCDKSSGVTEGSSTINMYNMSKLHKQYLDILNNLDSPIWQEVKQVIKNQQPDVIGLLSYTSSLASVKNVAKITKQINKSIIVICGGPHATIAPIDLIENKNIDYVIKGEGESTTLKLLNNINNSKKFADIKGLYYKNGNEILFTGEKQSFEDLDKLYLPAKHLLLNNKKLPSVVFQPIFTTRGCPHQCIYCTSHKIHGYKTRIFPLDKTIEEIKSLKQNFNVHHFFICDDTFGQNLIHTKELLNRIIDEKLHITWGCQTRGEKLNEELVFLMKKAGCTQVSIGVETGSPRIRKLIKKGNTVDDIIYASNLLKKYKIELAAFFMFGFPGETINDIKMSLDLLHKIQPYTAHCNIATPDPGTELLKMYKEKNRYTKKIDWNIFFHQNPVLFQLDNVDKKISAKVIDLLQRYFDSLNKKRQRMDLIKRFPLYIKIILKERLYKNPKYLVNKLKDLL